MKKLEAFIWLVIFTSITLLWETVSYFIKIVAIFLALFGKGKYRQYGISVWEGHDNAKSAELGGDPDESVSSRLGKGRERGSRNITFIANKVDLVAEELFGDLDHCKTSIERDEGGKQVTTY